MLGHTSYIQIYDEKHHDGEPELFFQNKIISMITLLLDRIFSKCTIDPINLHFHINKHTMNVYHKWI